MKTSKGDNKESFGNQAWISQIAKNHEAQKYLCNNKSDRKPKTKIFSYDIIDERSFST